MRRHVASSIQAVHPVAAPSVPSSRFKSLACMHAEMLPTNASQAHGVFVVGVSPVKLVALSTTGGMVVEPARHAWQRLVVLVVRRVILAATGRLLQLQLLHVADLLDLGVVVVHAWDDPANNENAVYSSSASHGIILALNNAAAPITPCCVPPMACYV
jgi:hypothetical protein